jgi:transcriptional regulator with XRE-family HTH domain
MHNGHFQLWLLKNRGNINNTRLAELVDISRVQLSRWTNGHARPSLDHFVILCKVLSIDEEHYEHLLVTGIKSMVTDIQFTNLLKAKNVSNND